MMQKSKHFNANLKFFLDNISLKPYNCIKRYYKGCINTMKLGMDIC